MKYLFIGNRFSVLEAMLQNNLSVAHILTPPDSYLVPELTERDIPFTFVSSKKEAVAVIEAASFDVLVSNGCPFILPVSAIKKPHQHYINIHPSPLPDLKGIHPINAAILFDRPAGAACHVMDDSIDGGSLITRITIPLTPDITLAKLYQLSFRAERDVFVAALARGFVPDNTLSTTLPYPPIYYSRKDEDLRIDLNEPADVLIRRVRAFGLPSQGAYFMHKGATFKVMWAELTEMPLPVSHYAEHAIVAREDTSIILRKGNEFLKFSGIIGDMESLAVGDLLSSAA